MPGEQEHTRIAKAVVEFVSHLPPVRMVGGPPSDIYGRHGNCHEFAHHFPPGLRRLARGCQAVTRPREAVTCHWRGSPRHWRGSPTRIQSASRIDRKEMAHTAINRSTIVLQRK